MPRSVDRERRLAEIAAATVRVAMTAGTQAVTIRSVADQLGGSTTLVTNYIPSRSGLIMNALDHASMRWRRELDAALAESADDARLSAVLEWSLTTDSDDPVLRRLVLEVVSNAALEPALRNALHHESAELRRLLSSAADASGFAEPELVADALYVVIRGVDFAATEDVDAWPQHRVRAVVDAVVAGFPKRPATA